MTTTWTHTDGTTVAVGDKWRRMDTRKGERIVQIIAIDGDELVAVDLDRQQERRETFFGSAFLQRFVPIRTVPRSSAEVEIEVCACQESLHLREALRRIHAVASTAAGSHLECLAEVHHLAQQALNLKPLVGLGPRPVTGRGDA